MPKFKYMMMIILGYFIIIISFYLNLPLYRYTVKQNLHTYRTNSYVRNTDGCINFTCKQGNITMCGNYTVEEKFGR